TPAPANHIGPWPAVFDPLVLYTLNLQLDPNDWDTIRRDTTNTIEVPALFWADGDEPILVSVRRKSSRALPSESNPIKVGLKVDINELVGGQTWYGLTKVSLENGADSGVLEEGLAWYMHNRATEVLGDPYPSGHASWVRVNVNGAYIGLYVNAEQRDKQALRKRGLWQSGATWLYEQLGGARSPSRKAARTAPRWGTSATYRSDRRRDRVRSPTTTPSPRTSTLGSTWTASLAQCAGEALSDNADALCTHGKNAFFADFSLERMTSEGRRRIYLPWDLDQVFRSPNSNMYASGTTKKGGRNFAQNPYEQVILNHPEFRARYNALILSLTEPGNGALSQAPLHAFLDDLRLLLSDAMADDPYPAPSVGGGFDGLRAFVTQRIDSVRAQAIANTNPPPRP
ncbi:MAG: CotH kinase family protein, partial [Candidatus Rokuibacteriota bacterium]